MKKLLLILLCFPMIGFGQKTEKNINAYKYIVIEEVKGRYVNKATKYLVNNLTKANFNVIEKNTGFLNLPSDLELNQNLAIYCYMNITEKLSFEIDIELRQYNQNVIFKNQVTEGFLLSNGIKKSIEGLIDIGYSYDSTLTKKASNYPNKTTNTGSWKGSGSGFFISKSGYIVTNNHVIDGWNQFQVEFKYNNEIRSFNAKVIKKDKINDLAILKIDDSKFSDVSAIPYNFKTRSIDIGTEIFALGYPLTTIMGKDVKFTDGKISSKTGFGGDITTYQIQVPIQPGNSGGPLFDFKGNLIGITSSGINRKLDLTENVNYAIKSSYLLTLIDVLPETITLPSSTQLASKELTEQIKILSDYVVLIKVR